MPRHPSQELKSGTKECDPETIRIKGDLNPMQYAALFEPADEGGFVITFPDFGWGVSQADSVDEAIQIAADLLRTLLQEHIRRGETLPKPGMHRGRHFHTIALPALQTAKTELYREFLESGIRKSELARRLHIPKTVIDRLFDLEHRTRLDQIEAAFRALGKELTVGVRAVA